ncbi:MAG: long-chain fatty acid--CoA ligase [Rhodobacteraceae bacterium]|nr:long-chain fatty acid--CoA ligase [Paracoccaceae bacterium]MBR9823599.1 long-chain fatty acid--CoA ligase [Paracoccaceae bacterium]
MRRLHEILDGRPAATIALLDHDGREISYDALDRMTHEMAGLLAAHGVRAGDRVILLSENCATFLVAALALSRLDAWIVLMNARATEAEVDRIRERSGARCVIFTPEASAASLAHATRMKATEIGRLDCGQVLVSPIFEAEPEPVEPDAGQVAVLMYTSGTVGEPKGVMLTHGNLLFTCNAGAEMRSLSPSDVMLGLLPGTHIFGLTSVMLATLKSGGRLVLMPRFDPDTVLDHLAAGVTVMPAVPQIFASLLKRLQERGEAPRHSLRFIYAGGAPVDLSLKKKVEAVFGIPLHIGYGLTEASPSVSSTRLDAPRDDGATGPAIKGVEVVIDSPDEKGVGEILVRGPNVMKGYYQNPEATAQTLREDGFLRTGDLGVLDADGSLFVVGRLKELIIHSGFNIYPPEVETVLMEHPSVTLCAVIGRARAGNEDVLAFVTTHGPVSEQELRDWVRARMVSYKVPARVLVVDALPQAPTGKILKTRLLGQFSQLLDEKEEATDA